MKNPKSILLLTAILIIGVVYYFMTVILFSMPINSSYLPVSTNPAGVKIPNFDHVILIIFENKSYDDITSSKSTPFINSLIEKGSSASNYFAISHPSLPNYLALVGGDTYGISSDCMSCFQNGENITDSIENSGRTWKAYMEGVPASCFTGDSGEYAQRHNPFIYFNDIRSDAKRCGNIVPLTNLPADLKSNTPNFTWISPDLCNSMHDCSAKTGDTWLSQIFPEIINSPGIAGSNYLIMITWDESEKLENNQVAAIFFGPDVKNGFQTNHLYNHYSLLKTIEASWNLPSLTGNDNTALPVSDIF